MMTYYTIGVLSLVGVSNRYEYRNESDEVWGWKTLELALFKALTQESYNTSTTTILVVILVLYHCYILLFKFSSTDTC